MPSPPSRDDHRLAKREHRQEWTGRGISRAVANRRAFPYLAGATLVLGIGAGVLARLTDPDDFHSMGDAVWWSIVTLGTVGYGDIVPHTAWGRVLGSLIIILGVTFISFLTAMVTSAFIGSQQETQHQKLLEDQRALNARLATTLARIEDRLSAIEARLDERQGR